jgi:predicted phosphodiesterase
MKRREFLKVSSLSAVLAGTGSVAPLLAAESPTVFAFASQPMLQNPTPDGITVVWIVKSFATGWVEYGETESLGQRSNGGVQGLNPLNGRLLKVRLNDLRPGTKYFYRVHSCPVDFKNAYDIQRGEVMSTPIRQFTTINPAAHTTSFSIINDTHEVQETLQGLGALLKANPTESLIWNGDIFNDIHSEQQLVERVFSPGGQAFATEMPLIPVRGNHDVRGSQARLLDQYFDLPSGLWYYTLRQGPVAFVVLDTGEDKPDNHPVYAGLNDFASYRTTQQQWLRQALQRKEFRSAPFRVALLHIPLIWKDYADPGDFCSDGKAKWHDLLVQAKVQIIISGHTHEVGWFAAGSEAPYAQLVGGGPKPAAATLIQGHADRRELRLTMQNLYGKELGNYTIKAL